MALLNLGFRAREHQVAAAGRGDHDHRRRVRDRAVRRQRSRRPTASSSGSTSPTSPARWTSRSVYLSRTALGEELARLEQPMARADRRRHDRRAGARHEQSGRRRDGLSRWACRRVEGLIRNRYTGRTFIEGGDSRDQEGRDQVHAAPRSARRQARAAGRGFDRPLDDDAGAAQPRFASWAAPRRFTSASPARRSSRPASTASTCRRSTSCSRRSFCEGGPLTDEVQAEMAASSGRRFAPLSAGRVDRPRHRHAQAAISARRASRAATRRRAARSCTRSPSTTSARRTAPAGPTKCSTNCGLRNSVDSRCHSLPIANASFIWRL